MNRETFISLCDYFNKCTISIAGHSFLVKDGSNIMPDEIGWCTEKGIYLNYKHSIINKLSEKEQTLFLTGVFVHELMHHLLSDFDVLESGLKQFKGVERRLLEDVNNIVEDPAIEYFSKLYIGGHLRKCLLFQINVLYSMANSVENYKVPLTQCINAMIMYGDMGIIKGHVTPQVQTILGEALQIFDKAIEEVEPKKRFEYSIEIKEIVKELLETEDNNEDSDGNNSDDNGNSDGNNSDDNGNSDGNNSDDNANSDGNNSDSNNSKGKNHQKKIANSDANNNVLDDLEKTLSSQGKNAMPQSKGKPQMKPAEEDKEDIKNDKKELQAKTLEELLNSKENKEIIDYTSCDSNLIQQGSDNREEYELSDEEINKIYSEIRKNTEIDLTNSKQVSPKDLDVPVTLSVSKYTPAVRNIIVHSRNISDYEYNNFKSSLNPIIMTLTKSLRNIFRQDMEEKEYSISGKVSMKRISSGKLSTRMFEKTKSPKEKQNMAVTVLIDESGSMNSQKIINAKQSAIILAETFAKFNVPLQIIGYSTEMSRDAVVQHHFMHWNNSIETRKALLSIDSYCSNFDSYSIRYATESLKKTKSEHKILIIISDGEPSAGFRNRKERFADLIHSVKEAKKVTDIIAIGLGKINQSNFKSFYGNNFIHIEKISDLPTKLSMQVRNIIKEW